VDLHPYDHAFGFTRAVSSRTPLDLELTQHINTSQLLKLRHCEDECTAMVDGREMKRLCDWSTVSRGYALNGRVNNAVGVAAYDLLEKLLGRVRPNPR